MDVIFIDTSFFERDNFFRGHKIKKLSEFASDGIIQIKMVDIVYREILKRMEVRLIESKAIIRNFDKTLSKEGKILKNLEKYESYFPALKVNIEEDKATLKKQLDDFIENSNVEIVSCNYTDIQEVFDQYFSGEPPFSEKGKKNEFPDACSLNTISKFPKDQNHNYLIISDDNDWVNYTNITEGISMVSNVSEYIDNKIQESLDAINVKLVEEGINNLYADLESEFYNTELDSFTEMLFDKVTDPVIQLEHEYDQIMVEKFEVTNHNIIELNEDYLLVEFTVNIDCILESRYVDLSVAMYDREDGIYYNAMNTDESSFYSTNVKIECAIHIEYTDESKVDELEIQNIDSVEIDSYELDNEKSTSSEDSGTFNW